ncbi:hypothetical protein [Paenibacillus odorifer]|uniref:hypothetical protein n=1 Tax=Paenibacillus odorifer TaxID=189426 RepID=UPI00096F74AD|nr:hypothetical protein [Paenibacillus odorifer]OMD71218.1 hypothetical protein BSK50_26430 [Paenibacillus odorifer]
MAKLTAAKINKLNKALDKKRKIYILEDNDEVNISVEFKESLVEKVIMDYISILEKINSAPVITDELLRGTAGILHLFILREFSDVPMIPKTNDDIQKLVDVTHALYDTGIMEAVIEGFNHEQVQKVYSKLDASSKRAGELMGELVVKQTIENTQEEKREETLSDGI